MWIFKLFGCNCKMCIRDSYSGSEEEICEFCGDYYTKETPALGHDWNRGETTEDASCESDGEKTYTCRRCGDKKKETILATGHSWVRSWHEDATCTDAVSYTHLIYQESGETRQSFLTLRNCELFRKSVKASHFFGREEELYDLKEMFFNSGKYLISGIGGIGKTELMRQLLSLIHI